MTAKDFYYNEFRQLGTDYNSIGEVADYDRRMRQFRDVDAENRLIGGLTRLDATSEVLEIGTGTGAFARYAAGICRRVHAIDISTVMLDYARGRAAEEKLENISFGQDGFLSFESPDNAWDAVVSSLALHHLPDVWKMIALNKIFRIMRPGGIFVLIDVVFDWKNEDPEQYFERILEYAPGSRENFAMHIAGEFSTLSWIMRGMLEQAGFVINSDQCRHDFLHFYSCEKP